jgi:hypothetical protein
MKRISDIPKKENFKAPDGYFDELPDKLRTRIEAGKEEHKTSLIQAFKPYLYFAAFFIGLAFLVKTGLNIFTNDYRSPVVTEQIAQNDTQYFEYDLISEELIYEELTADVSVTETDGFDEETVIAYLIEDEVESLIFYE